MDDITKNILAGKSVREAVLSEEMGSMDFEFEGHTEVNYSGPEPQGSQEFEIEGYDVKDVSYNTNTKETRVLFKKEG